jgi:hypothetical protein
MAGSDAGESYPLRVPDNESVLFVPLRSNASTLLAGAPVAAFRRRLKFASLFYDRLYLEAGVLRLQAGPNGHFSTIALAPANELPRWQTPSGRHAVEQAPLHVAIGRESVPGVPPPPERMQTAIYSDTTVSWVATLHPFARELPAGTDWVELIRSADPTGEVGRLAQQWTWTDERNSSLERAIPERFVRGAVIKNVNRDLAIAMADGVAAVVDPFHMRVVTQRFRDDDSWKLRGYAVPILFPRVGDLPWQAIADLRRDPNIARFRAVLREVEEVTVAEALGGDIERAAYHVYERQLADARKLEGVTAPAGRAVGGFVIGGASGFAVAGLTGPVGIVAGAALGTGIGTVVDVRNFLRQRRSGGWVALQNRLRNQDG